MFDKNFFPTPKTVINKMIQAVEGLRKRERYITVLEPSAGKGDILDAISDHYERYYKPKMFAIEKQPELQAILRDNFYSVIGTDFLTDDIQIMPDVIIMNPPFDHGDKHLLRAYEILAPGGQLVCLLNSETINNPHSESRRLLGGILNKEGAEVVDLGQCFKGAERSTNVNTSMVVLTKEGSISDYFDLNDMDNSYFEMPEMDEDNSVEILDELLNREHRFNASVEAYKNLVKAYKTYKDTVRPLIKDAPSDAQKDLDSTAHSTDLSGFVTKLGAICWQDILDKTKLTKFMTRQVRDEFNAKFQHQKNLAFTKNNIVSLLDMLFNNKTNILDQNLIEVFENLTKHHKKNRLGVEGWATNSHYKVNRKVIFPRGLKYGEHMSSYQLKEWGDTFSTNYDIEQTLNDLDRALCYITGEKYPTGEFVEGKYVYDGVLTIAQALNKKFKQLGKVYTGDKIDNVCESHFFKIKFHRKGTLHLEFKDKTLWQYFNMKVAEIKGFPLPESESDTIKKKAKKKGFGAKNNQLMLT